ncbi:MAG: hypothetical protein AAGG09_21165 [Pseudomonadota bacterium]
MARTRWHIVREGEALTVARRVPLRWDVSAETRLPPARRLRVAHQVRQDLWRMLRRQRGFAPQVRVCPCDDGLQLRAGGRMHGVYDRGAVEGRIADLLADPDARARWIACAEIRQRSAP